MRSRALSARATNAGCRTYTLRAGLLLTLGAVVALAQAPFEGFPAFKDVAPQAGLTLMNVSGEGANDYIIEANGNGAAFFDYDNDGDMDVLITNGSTIKRYARGGDPVVALYENVGGGRFVERMPQRPHSDRLHAARRMAGLLHGRARSRCRRSRSRWHQALGGRVGERRLRAGRSASLA